MAGGTASGWASCGGLPALVKSNADTRSEHTSRRHREMLGSATPVTFSRNCSVDVWSATEESTKPPMVHGDTIVMGTRGPRPIGLPEYQSASLPETGRGAMGGGTWSKKPSFSSKLTRSAVLDQVSRSEATVSSRS
jgi:hypothetical protein